MPGGERGGGEDMSESFFYQAKKEKQITETKIVNKDANTNEKSEVENTRRRRMVGLEEQKKYIHADVYGEILSYLPGRKLQTLKIVCKDWLRLIISSNFARLHISRANRGHIRVLNQYFGTRGFLDFLEYNSYYKETIQRRIPFPAQFSRWTTILGSADGLTFLLDENPPYTTAVFNPSTLKCFCVQLSPPLPPNIHSLRFYWFGKIGGSEEYILVMGLSIDGTPYQSSHLEIWVYKFSRSSNILNRILSTQVRMEIRDCLKMGGTFVQGVVHWPHYKFYRKNRIAIFAYDLDKNECKEISLPVECNNFHIRLGLFVDGCSLLATNRKSIWIMKDGCWTKYANVELSTDVYSDPLLDPLGFFSNGDIIMEVDQCQLMKYSFTRKEATNLAEYDSPMVGVIVCADTLLSPGC